MLHRTGVVAWKEFRTFFQTPMGYVILFVFTTLAGWLFFYAGGLFERREASLRGLFQTLPTLFLIYAPAVTMRLWAEERKTGTFEVLMTLPLRPWEAVLGKFLAAVGVIAVFLVCQLPAVIVVCWLGDPDPGPIVGGLLGALLLGAAYVAIGLAASAVTENQIIALIAAASCAFLFHLLSNPLVTALFPGVLGGFLHNVALDTHFRSIERGVVDTRDLLYYATFVVFFLSVNVWAVRRDRRPGINLVLIAGILILVNHLGGQRFLRLDLTEDRRYTLSPATRELLADLDDNLQVRVFLSSGLPSQLANLHRDVGDLLGEMESLSAARLKVEMLDPETSEAAARAAEQAGLQEFQVAGGDARSQEVRLAYLGLTLDYRDRSEVISPIPGADRLEYELALCIDKLTRPEMVKVGFQITDPLGGQRRPGQPPPRKRDRHTLNSTMTLANFYIRKQFDTVSVTLDRPVPAEVRTLIVANSPGMDERDEYHLDQFLMRGGRLLVLADGSEPSSFGGPQSPRKPSMRSPVENPAGDLFAGWGFEVRGDVILDRRCGDVQVQVGLIQGMTPDMRSFRYPPWMQVLEDSLEDHPITRGVKVMLLPFASSVRIEPRPGVEAIPLVRSSPNARALRDSMMMLDPQGLVQAEDPEQYRDQYLVAAMLLGEFRSRYSVTPIPPSVREDWQSTQQQQAALLDPLGAPSPSSSSAGGSVEEVGMDIWKERLGFLDRSPSDGRIVVVGNSDFVSDAYAQNGDNLLFLTNAVNELTSDRDLTSVRARMVVARPFEEPSDAVRRLSLAFGMYLVPMLLLGLGLWVYLWRRVWRPAQVRESRDGGEAPS